MRIAQARLTHSSELVLWTTTEALLNEIRSSCGDLVEAYISVRSRWTVTWFDQADHLWDDSRTDGHMMH